MADIVALQLYTIRDEMEKDFKQTLRRVADIGYAGVEFAYYGYGDRNLSPTELADLLAETGLKAVGSHVSLDRLNHNFEREIAYLQAIGKPFCFLPWVNVNTINNSDSLKRFAEQLNELGRRIQSQGITFGYHNHDFEFTNVVDGQTIYEHLIANTDPALVKFELDTYWAAFAGQDVVELIKKLDTRVVTLHLKDMTADRTFTEVGDGTLRIADYIEAGQEAGVKIFIVENDKPAIPSLDSARRSFENLYRSLAWSNNETDE